MSNTDTNITARYVGTMFCDYLQDSHSRPGETLLLTSLGCDLATTVESLIESMDDDCGLPESVSDADLARVIRAELAGVDLRYIDEHGERHDEPPEWRDSEEPYLYVALQWEADSVPVAVATFTNIYGEPMREWSDPYGYGFTLCTWDTGRTDRHGKSCLAYTFHDAGFVDTSAVPVFAGEDFYVGLTTAIDSDEAIASLLTFLSLQPSDTDADYFDDYTPRQLAWCAERAEELSMCAIELSEECGE